MKELIALSQGRANSVTFYTDGTVATDVPLANSLVLSGSFNPVHTGHLGMAEVASQRFPDRPLTFELSIANPDKALLDIDVLLFRVSQFHGKYPITVTSHPLFIDKADLFPDSIFIVGADTALRIVNPKYYGNLAAAMTSTVANIIHKGCCRFLVVGRALEGLVFTNGFNTIEKALGADLVSTGFIFLNETDFRIDISSSQLRG